MTNDHATRTRVLETEGVVAPPLSNYVMVSYQPNLELEPVEPERLRLKQSLQ